MRFGYLFLKSWMDVCHFLGDGAGLFVPRPAAGFLSAVERLIVGMFVRWRGSKWEVSEFDYLTLLRKADLNCAMRMHIFWRCGNFQKTFYGDVPSE